MLYAFLHVRAAQGRVVADLEKAGRFKNLRQETPRMATLEEAKAAKPLALKMFEEMGVRAGVGFEGSSMLVADFVLSVHLQEETTQELPKTIEGIPVVYRFVGTVRPSKEKQDGHI